MTTNIPMTASNLESEVRDLIQQKYGTMTPADRSSAIANHAKAVLQNATSAGRQMIADLIESLHALDQKVAVNEARLMTEIEQHVAMASEAAKSAKIIRDAAASWGEKSSVNGRAR